MVFALVSRDTFRNLELDKQQKVLAAAIDEFASHGFRQASINRIVQRLGIAKGSIFQYFGTKEGLFKIIFDYAVELVKNSLRRVREDTAELDFFERIRRSLQTGIRFIDQHPQIFKIYLKMIFQEDFPLRTEFIQKVHLFSSDYLTSLVEMGKARGDLREDLDIQSSVFFLDALMDRFLQAYCVSYLDAGTGLYQASPDELNKKINEFIQVIRAGMGNNSRNTNFSVT